MRFAIISYYITAFGEAAKVYEKVDDPTHSPALISPKEARDIIRRYGMERVHEGP